MLSAVVPLLLLSASGRRSFALAVDGIGASQQQQQQQQRVASAVLVKRVDKPASIRPEKKPTRLKLDPTSFAGRPTATLFEKKDGDGSEGSGSDSHPLPSVEPRIVGGYDAPRGRHPYMASLRYGGPYNHVCGGTLIAPDLVLSAGHCAPFFDTVDIGRYDISDNLEPYTTEAEIFVIESFVTHPEYTIEQSDSTIDFNMDFLLIKLYGTSELEPVKLNTDEFTPSNLGDGVSVMGWGLESVSSKRPADVLNVADLSYVPNDKCDDAQGYVDGTFYYGSYNRLIRESMMCAAAEREDSCQGDSGGPLVIKGSNSATDVQVGIVSFGFGCADADFPGVYSRVSNQFYWIRQEVCKLSVDPPSYFGCTLPSEPSGGGGEKRTISLTIQFDEFPWEQGCLLTSVSGRTTYANHPVGAFKTFDSYSVFNANVEVDADREYKLVMLDAFGDGMSSEGSEGRYWVHSEADGAGDVLASGGGNYGLAKEHYFTVGELEAAPPPTPAPATESPQIPMDVQDDSEDGDGEEGEEEVFISIVIQFDSFPEEVAFVVSDVRDQTIVTSKKYGDYDESYANSRITETVRLFGRSTGTRDYLITFLDKSGDGICCGWGDGSYEIYWGAVEDGELLFSGKEAYAMEQWLLTVLGEDDPRRSDVPVPSPTAPPAAWDPTLADDGGSSSWWDEIYGSPSSATTARSMSGYRILSSGTLPLSVWLLLSKW